MSDPAASLGDVLFSKTQRQVLGLLFGNPGRSYYANEIVHHASVGIGSVQRELEKLAGAGLLTVSRCPVGPLQRAVLETIVEEFSTIPSLRPAFSASKTAP